MGQFIQFVWNLYDDVPVELYNGVLYVLCCGAFFSFFQGGRKKWRHFSYLLLIEYIFLIYSSTLFCRISSGERLYNYMPFWSYVAIYQEGRLDLVAEIIMNVLAFVPIGSLIGLVLPGIKWWKVLLTGFCMSMSIEVLQLVFKIGFSEVDDIIHNTIGSMLGLCLLTLFKRKNLYG